MSFRVESSYQPTGDQPKAIEALCQGLREGRADQVLLGVTGSGKTFTMAHVIAQAKRPALVLAHNKTLAGQLFQELSSLLPEMAVEYFVSYYDYYQPEAYVPTTDTYVEKDSSINDEIDRMRPGRPEPCSSDGMWSSSLQSPASTGLERRIFGAR